MKAGQVIAGRYRIESRLGVGGMGEVWRAIHTGTGRDFAIKFMHAHAAASENARQRFSREARASAKINHPNIIDVFDVGEMDDGVLYLVMELLDGVALGDAFHADPPISVQDLFSVLLDTSQALAAAHAVGIIHRDIKPANVFLHKDRATGLAFAKVLDFGISKFTGDDVATRTGSILGSPRYMSPEQTRSAAAADARRYLGARRHDVRGPHGHVAARGRQLLGARRQHLHRAAEVDRRARAAAARARARGRAAVPRAVRRARPVSERALDAVRGRAARRVAREHPGAAPADDAGRGLRVDDGLRVRPPSVSSLSASRNQARSAAAQQQMEPAVEPAAVVGAARAAPAAVAPDVPAAHRAAAGALAAARASVPMPPPQRPPPATAMLPVISDDTTTRNGGGAIEPATLAYDPATLAYDPSTAAQPGPARPISALRASTAAAAAARAAAADAGAHRRGATGVT